MNKLVLAALLALAATVAEGLAGGPIAFSLPAGAVSRRISRAGEERLRAGLAASGAELEAAGEIDLLFEIFNVFNHVNFGLPVADLNSVNFGRIFSAGPPRLTQFALKFSF